MQNIEDIMMSLMFVKLTYGLLKTPGKPLPLVAFVLTLAKYIDDKSTQQKSLMCYGSRKTFLKRAIKCDYNYIQLHHFSHSLF